jgi:hypothetical protein
MITAAYLRVRYGEIPETNEEINQVESAWENVRTLGKAKQSQISKSKRKSNGKKGKK